jgi:hypothetical protein
MWRGRPRPRLQTAATFRNRRMSPDSLFDSGNSGAYAYGAFGNAIPTHWSTQPFTV